MREVDNTCGLANTTFLLRYTQSFHFVPLMAFKAAFSHCFT
ncbi:hypothetical protein ppKF707_1146 [Metapseudomonas furukawaii]|uniref:Uncharacterized protein n=1 Tax=Metapseudomonas furukawaii TaxID=1149133 RepID=A0AAD1C5G4_METFU|nr:hypothetical protein ppKF707_1146 [Pseudomonas furukawaii]BAU77432.1 hypothetical protein KF707C_p430 [Pseudomonas furukawaii]